MHRYGMRLRPFSIGCQPMQGLEKVEDDSKYWNILTYNRKLTEEEIRDYELDYLGEYGIMGGGYEERT